MHSGQMHYSINFENNHRMRILFEDDYDLKRVITAMQILRARHRRDRLPVPAWRLHRPAGGQGRGKPEGPQPAQLQRQIPRPARRLHVYVRSSEGSVDGELAAVCDIKNIVISLLETEVFLLYYVNSISRQMVHPQSILGGNTNELFGKSTERWICRYHWS